MIRTGLETALMRELRELRLRFHRAAIHAGSDPEFVAESTPEADRLIDYAERIGGPGEPPIGWRIGDQPEQGRHK